MLSPTSPPDYSRIAVVTVSYASGAVLEPLLKSLRRDYPGSLRIIVADNKPDGDAVKPLAELYSTDYLALPENPGYGSAINSAVSSCVGEIDWILVCNPDLSVSAEAIGILVSTAETDPLIAMVGPKILQPDGEIYPSARTIPSLRTGIGHALFANIWKKNPWSTKYHNAQEADTRRETGWLSGACFLVRKSAFDRLNGFDDGYFMYFEDVDLGYRAGLAGYKNIYEPRAIVSHTGAHSTQENSSHMLRIHHESAARFLGKKYSHPLMWPVRVALKLGLWFRGRLMSKRTG